MTKQDGTAANPDRKPQSVYQAIAAVTGALAKEGISKNRKNEQQGYKFRGIDDVYNALAPALAEHHLCVLPTVLSRELVERTNHKGTALFYVTVQARFDFVSAEDGSKHEVVTYGEAMDSGDKATNKAMSAAYKYACMQAFCIPTEGDNDADAATHQVASYKGTFESKELLDLFVTNSINAINAATSGKDVINQKDLNLARWNAMKGSANPLDNEGFEKICAAYNTAFKAFKIPPKDPEPVKPATVDAAKAGLPASVASDSIPY